MGKLVLVPTPIGNLGDITYRAVETLNNADLIYAEDTRVTQKLLNHYNIKKPLQSFHQANEHKILDRAVEQIEQNTLTALVSDAGMPGISDPGFLLVRACREKEIDVECLPGASAFVTALAASGLPCDTFVFEGFLPHKKGRQKKLTELKGIGKTTVLYESPHRVEKLLKEIEEVFGDQATVVIGRELTKKFEEYLRGKPPELLSHFSSKPPKGEFVVLIDGAGMKEQRP